MATNSILDGIKNVHFIGIGGSGMLPLAEILHGFGFKVTGSDINEGSTIDILRGMGVAVTIPHSGDCVNGAELVVYTAALLPGNVELAAAKAAGIPCVERSVMLGAVSDRYAGRICISGTHGKTTATAMATQMLLMAGVDTAAVIGGKLPYIKGYGRHGNADCITVEACEFSNTFLKLNPTTAVILNIDEDHLDFFGSMENLIASFKQFAQKAKYLVLANGDDENTLQLVTELKDKKVLLFGIGDGCHFQAADIRVEPDGYYSFTALHMLSELGRVKLSVPGRHNIYNALVAVALGVCERLPFNSIAAGIEAFKGAGRRFEILDTVKGITVADDYAHHPAEVEATIKAAKSLNYKRVIALHQPFTYSRTKLLFNEFSDALKLADYTLLTEIMGGREVDPGDITAAMLARSVGCDWVRTFEEATDELLKVIQPGDLVITMGCGDVYKAANLLVKKLKEQE